jgi:hypothetical protein
VALSLHLSVTRFRDSLLAQGKPIAQRQQDMRSPVHKSGMACQIGKSTLPARKTLGNQAPYRNPLADRVPNAWMDLPLTVVPTKVDLHVCHVTALKPVGASQTYILLSNTILVSCSTHALFRFWLAGVTLAPHSFHASCFSTVGSLPPQLSTPRDFNSQFGR